MSLKNQIEQDFLTAYKSQDQDKVSVLRLLKSAIQNAEIAKKAELSDEEITSVLQKEVKQRRETAEDYRKADRIEPAKKEEAEIEIINNYLPKQLEVEELTQIIKDTISELNADNSKMGQVIGAVIQKTKGRADGGQISRITRELLA